MTPPWEREPLGRLLYPFSFLYRAALELDRLIGGANRKRLPGRVISVGNITVGGSGKTPLVMAITPFLRDKGYKVAILSRGYRGKGGKKGALVSDGRRVLVGPEVSGDEPQVLARALSGVVVAVGKDRYGMGLWVWERFGTEVFVLDDGFQQWGLERDLDLVCLDPDTDLERAELLPSGPFREPPKALMRASALVITYWEPSPKALRLKERLTSFGKPIFLAPAAYEGLIGRDGFFPLEALKGRKVAILLGIAKPQRFLRALQGLGIRVEKAFLKDDHHRWTKGEVEEAARGVEAILTTEKDLVKLPPLDIPVYALKLSLRPEEGLWDFLLQGLSG